MKREQEIRELFEKLYSEEDYLPDFTRTSYGNYVSHKVQYTWDGFLLALKAISEYLK